MKRTFLFATIASILSINAYAVTSTVTSKDYVDAADTLKQNKIPATDAGFTRGSVVETTEDEGVVIQREIFDPNENFDYGNNEIATGHEGDLVTAGDIFPAVGSLYNTVDDISNMVNDIKVNNLPTTTVTYKTCTEWSGTPHTDANCLLWNLSDKYVATNCTTNSDCTLPCAGYGSGRCINAVCDYTYGCSINN